MTNRAVFLDRDGTLIEHYDYLTDPQQVQLQPRAGAALRLLRRHGFLLVVVTNQSAVARGMLTEKKLAQIHDRLQYLLRQEGVFLDRIYYCPYHPDGTVEAYRRDSDLRKPKPGMLYLAARELGIDLSKSWIVGDDDRDVETGRAAGCRTVMLESRGSSLVRKGQSNPDFVGVNLQEAANLIIRHSKEMVERPVEPAAGSESNQEMDMTETPKVSEGREDRESQEEKPGRQPPSEEDTTVVLDTNDQIDIETLSEGIEGKDPIASEDEADREGTQILRSRSEGEEAAGEGSLHPEKDLIHALPNVERILGQILRELKTLNRERQMPAEFSVFKLLAGVVQMLVIFCLVLAFWFGTSPDTKADTVQHCLLVAAIFQILTLTLIMLHRHP